jgi:integrase
LGLCRSRSDRRRPRGQIQPRGGAFQVILFAGRDPLTGYKLYLRQTATTEVEARRTLTKLVARVDEQKHPKTRATFRVAMDEWLRTHEVEETTRASYVEYARVHLYPAFGDVPVGPGDRGGAGGVLRRAAPLSDSV